jgi:hypothetical protein
MQHVSGNWIQMFARFFNRNERYRGIESNDDWQSEYVFWTFRCWKIDFSQCYGTYFASKTKTISEASKQGQHTTTFAEMYDLSFDARIIDTPGIKGFGIVDMEKEEISGYFQSSLN